MQRAGNFKQLFWDRLFPQCTSPYTLMEQKLFNFKGERQTVIWKQFLLLPVLQSKSSGLLEC